MTDTVLYGTAETVAVISAEPARRDERADGGDEGGPAGRAAPRRRGAGARGRVTGNGRGFCAGQDLVEHAETLAGGRPRSDTVREHYNPIVLEIMTMPKPVVAAVNGVAAGAGAALALRVRLPGGGPTASFVMSFRWSAWAPTRACRGRCRGWSAWPGRPSC